MAAARTMTLVVNGAVHFSTRWSATAPICTLPWAPSIVPLFGQPLISSWVRKHPGTMYAMVCPNSIDFPDVLSGGSTHGPSATSGDVRYCVAMADERTSGASGAIIPDV